MNYTSNSLPEAFVSVGKNKNRLKIYNGKNVFIKDKEEFQIELFNPTQKTIGAKILINGTSISNSLLILKPGERSYLERYLDDNKKFVFETYNVENSAQVKEAIKKNGELRIEFFNEKVVASRGYTTFGSGSCTTLGTYYSSPTIAPSNPFIITCQNLSGSITGTSSNAFSSGINIAGTTNTGTANLGTTSNTLSNTMYFSTGDFSLSDCTITTTPNVAGTTTVCDMSTGNISSTLETGRIEKGESSNQSFTNYYGEFDSICFRSVEFKLLPESHKPIEVKDIRQYCPGCRTRIKKSSWKFCPSCGESLD